MNLKSWLKKTDFARKVIKINNENSAEERFLKKKVYKELRLFDGDIKKINQIGDTSFSLKDNVIILDLNDDVENLAVRKDVGITIDINNYDLSEFNRLYLKVFIKAVGFVNFYFHFSIGNSNLLLTHTASIIPNRDNEVVFEIDDDTLKDATVIKIIPFLFGTPPEAEPEFTVFIKDISAQRVDLDYTLGWMAKDVIAYSHVGYFKNAKKEAIVANALSDSFYLYNSLDQVVYSNQVKRIKSNLGEFVLLDFSSFKDEGCFYLKIDDKSTNLFEINDNPYESSIWKSILFLKSLRCGENVDGIHSACHLNCRTKNNHDLSVPNFGGWHDAGDVSQFEICTAEIADALLELSDTLKLSNKKLSERLLEESRVGTDWLLRTVFPNGERALAVGYKMWRRNELKATNQGVLQNFAEIGPFESFLSCIALARSAHVYQKSNQIYSDWCLRIAILDYKTAEYAYKNNIYTKRWGPSICSVLSGAGAIASSLLYRITKDLKYLEDGIKFGDLIIKCQERDYPNWDIPIRGFFYEDVNHEYMLSFEHRGHEQMPITGIVELMRTYPESKNYQKWKEVLLLYKEYIIDTIKYTSPFGLCPAHIYILDKINIERFTIPPSFKTKEDALADLIRQAKSGIRLHDNVYLRIFPIALQRRGFHATLLSKTKAISAIANILGDEQLKEIAIKQLEWILGKNPFSTSTMYGQGYNYHMLYVAYSPQLEGSLPVGFMTKGDLDLPYWPVVNNAVYKEVWGHTTGKFLSIFIDLLNLKS